jgi:hypothetical protein
VQKANRNDHLDELTRMSFICSHQGFGRRRLLEHRLAERGIAERKLPELRRIDVPEVLNGQR